MKKKFPKKAKLITDGGFYRIIKLDRPVLRIAIPLMTKIQITQPEINTQVSLSFQAEFSFERVCGGYAEFRQVDVIQKL